MSLVDPLPTRAPAATCPQLASADAASAAHPLVDRNLLGGCRRVPGPTPTRRRMALTMALWRSQSGPQARERRLRARPGPRAAKARATAGNRMLTPFARRSAAIADAPKTPGCLGSLDLTCRIHRPGVSATLTTTHLIAAACGGLRSAPDCRPPSSLVQLCTARPAFAHRELWNICRTGTLSLL